MALLATHLEAFAHRRQQADTCEDPAARVGVLRHLRAEASDLAAVLAGMARQEPDLGEALRRHLC